METKIHKYKPIRVGLYPDWADITHWTLYLNWVHRGIDNLFMITTPNVAQDAAWTIIPTVTVQRTSSVAPGLSFRLHIKWLRWNVFTMELWRGYKVEETDEQY